ncbi:MAG: TniQ family protein [Gammaproteobacteria bacterium]|nr:TniQ family protein [Gammaproteobacteria bacterium]
MTEQTEDQPPCATVEPLFNWERTWCRRYVSIWAMLHRFMVANALRPSEMVSLFSENDVQKRQEMIDPRLSGTRKEEVFQQVGVSVSELNRGYALSIGLTGFASEIATSLRYCPRCIGSGLHFSWQQLVWLPTCPIHGRSLRNSCECGRKVRYRLSGPVLAFGSRCECGKPNLVYGSRLSEEENLRAAQFEVHLGFLKSKLCNGMIYPRVKESALSEEEVLRAYKLTHNVLRSWIDKCGADIARVSLRSIRTGEVIFRSSPTLTKNAFQRYFDKTKAFDFETRSIRQRDLVLGRMEEEICKPEFPERFATILGLSNSMDEETVLALTLVFASRLINSARLSNWWDIDLTKYELVGEALSTFCQPLCLYLPRRFELGEGDAYWPRDNSYHGASDHDFVTPLCRFLLKTFYGGRGGDKRFMKLLNRIQRRSGRISAHERQLDWLMPDAIASD